MPRQNSVAGLVLAGCLLGIAMAPSVEGAVVTLGSNASVGTIVRNTSPTVFKQKTFTNPLSADVTGTDMVANSDASAATTYDVSNAGFSFTVQQTRGGKTGTNAETNGVIQFSIAPSVAGGIVTFQAAGHYDVTNNPGTGAAGVSSFSEYLLDLTTSTYLFTTSDIAGGSPGGSLNPSHQYQYEIDGLTWAENHDDAGTSATGGFSLLFGETDPVVPTVPEPASVAVTGIGLAMLLMRARKANS